MTDPPLRTETEFLLRSLDDLDQERDAGELDDRQYRRLVDEYTARAAAALRVAEPDGSAPAVVGAAAKRRRGWVAAGVLAFVAVVALVLPSALGRREAGQTITGNTQSQPVALDRLATAARQRPEDPAARRAYARALLEAGESVDALKEFDAAARLDPSDAESRAYGGWIVFLAGLPDEALRRLDAAVAARPDYPDAHFFRGMVLLRGKDDPAGAAGELRRYLELTPAGAPLRADVERVLQTIDESVPSSTSSTSPGSAGPAVVAATAGGHSRLERAA